MKTLTLIDKAFWLKRSPLFNALDLDLLLIIAHKLSLVIFEAGDFIFVAEEEANRMYFITEGQVEIQDTSKRSLCVLEAGNFFGEESLFSNKPRKYAAFAITKTQLLTLSRSNLYTIISECPSVAMGFLQVYTSAVQFRPIKVMENPK